MSIGWSLECSGGCGQIVRGGENPPTIAYCLDCDPIKQCDNCGKKNIASSAQHCPECGVELKEPSFEERLKEGYLDRREEDAEIIKDFAVVDAECWPEY